MPAHDKDDLSRFFRKASQKPDIKFHEEDWTKLEAMLDKASVQNASSGRLRRKVAVIAVVSLLFFSAATYLLVTKPASITTNKTESVNGSGKSNGANDPSTSSIVSKSTPVMISELKKSGVEIPREVSSRDNTSIDSDRKITNSAPRSSEIKKSKKHLYKEPNTINSNNSNISNPTTLKVSTPHTMASTERSSANKDKVITKERTSDAQQGQLSTGVTPDAYLVNNVISLHDGTKSDRQEKALHTFATTISSDSAATVNKDSVFVKREETTSKTDTTSEENKVTHSSRISVLLSFSPDFSSNGLKRLTTPGEALGLTAYYRIAKNFSVLGGIIGSNKKYLGYGKEYKPNESHYWSKHTNGVLPEEIHGSCYMIEIPLGLQYTMLNMKRSRLLVSGMLSSYIMYNESYSYSFENENPGAAQGWKSTKTTSYPFSIAGASVSYERDVSNHFAIGLSPYLKIPLRDMGSWTSMKLYTFGAAFTVRYTLRKKKLPDRPILQQRSD